jgi:hypothetical protein
LASIAMLRLSSRKYRPWRAPSHPSARTSGSALLALETLERGCSAWVIPAKNRQPQTMLELRSCRAFLSATRGRPAQNSVVNAQPKQSGLVRGLPVRKISAVLYETAAERLARRDGKLRQLQADLFNRISDRCVIFGRARRSEVRANGACDAPQHFRSRVIRSC